MWTQRSAPLSVIVAVLGPEIVLTPNVGYKPVHPTYKKCASDVEKVCIRRRNSVHRKYEKCASDLRKVCIRSTKSVHPTYKVCILPTKSMQPTYKKYAADLQ